MQYDDRNSKLQPLAYASRVLNKAETNYSTTHLEALGVVWALKHFKDIIHGYDTRVRTGHAAVVELFNTKSLVGKLARWALIVQDFNPTFFVRVPGVVNNVTDSLSQYNGAVDDTDEDVITRHDAALSDSICSAQREDAFCQP